MLLFLKGLLQDINYVELIMRASGATKQLILPKYGNYDPQDDILKPIKGIVCCDCDDKKSWVTADEPEIVLQNDGTIFIPEKGVLYLRALFSDNGYKFSIAQAGVYFPRYGIVKKLPFSQITEHPARD